MPDFRQTIENVPKIRRMRGGDLKIEIKDDVEHREFKPGSHWARLEMGEPDHYAPYFIVTTGAAKRDGTKGERKIERDLPSGQRIRIFREGASFGVKNYSDEKNPDPTDHLYRLSALDACYLAKNCDNVHIEPRREVLGDLGDEYTVDDQRKSNPDDGCPECGGSKFGRGWKHSEGCPKHK